MWCVCKFDEARDLQQVVPFGYVDIVKVYRNSALDVPVALLDVRYNMIEDPRSIGDRPDDGFGYMQAEKAIMSYSVPSGDDVQTDVSQ